MSMDASDSNATVIFDTSNSKYLVLFDRLAIETTVTDKASIAEEWVQQVLSTYVGKQMVIGLDTEWMRDQNKKMKVAILQLCVEDKCLIFQMFRMDYIPQSLRSFMVHSDFKFVGVGILQDIKRLNNEYGLECNEGIDVSKLAKTQWPNRFSSLGLKNLAKELVGLNMKKSKEVCTSEWQLRELTLDQVEYACIDAYASYKIGKKLLIENGVSPTLFN
ncbi:Werner Syndrome-like exonuclease [Abrus precatorius]|uniref:Werner Syndrome-like exonuclease n=1 Tax=Abrus precatorius TaxID=3816 RepID=A0A8B8K733_ABRPR|nr:Werner Syndrome-like exonuclease [Abrus precatorius]